MTETELVDFVAMWEECFPGTSAGKCKALGNALRNVPKNTAHAALARAVRSARGNLSPSIEEFQRDHIGPVREEAADVRPPDVRTVAEIFPRPDWGSRCRRWCVAACRAMFTGKAPYTGGVKLWMEKAQSDNWRKPFEEYLAEYGAEVETARAERKAQIVAVAVAEEDPQIDESLPF